MLELKKVTKRWGNFTAVNEVDLQIKAGEFLTLLGPSGCGKTTMLRMISGFETPSEGVVLLDGQDVTYTPPYRRAVNQVFQSYALFPHLSIRENIEFGLRMKKVPRPDMDVRVNEAITMVALTGMEDRKPSQLSGGQRQRVALARAIVNRPKVLLLDEPLSALDAKLRHTMQIELKRLQSKLGITFIFVTHDQEEALTMSDRIAVVNKGKIEQLGSVDEIYHRPRTTFVANFIGMANIIDATVLSRDGNSSKMQLEGGVQVRVPLPRSIHQCQQGAGLHSPGKNQHHQAQTRRRKCLRSNRDRRTLQRRHRRTQHPHRRRPGTHRTRCQRRRDGIPMPRRRPHLLPNPSR